MSNKIQMQFKSGDNIKFQNGDRVKTTKAIQTEFGLIYYYGYPVSKIPVGSKGTIVNIYQVNDLGFNRQVDIFCVKFDNGFKGVFMPDEIELVAKTERGE